MRNLLIADGAFVLNHSVSASLPYVKAVGAQLGNTAASFRMSLTPMVPSSLMVLRHPSLKKSSLDGLLHLESQLMVNGKSSYCMLVP